MFEAQRPKPTRSVFLLAVCLASVPQVLRAQEAPAASTAPARSPVRQIGTVKAIEASTVTLVTAAGSTVTVPIAASAAVLQLAPGSTDLKTATPAKFSDIAVGDRVSIGKAGDTDSASRVILMKGSDIAARKATQQADWQAHGTGGLVKALDGPMLTVSAGSRTLKVATTPTTIFRRYADDSVKFEDAKPGNLSQIQTGDQLSVRGARTEADGTTTIAAEEVVTGTFSNLSGSVSAVDLAAGVLTLRDLTTKKTVTIKVTGNSDLRRLPPEAAATFASRSNGSSTAGGGSARPAGSSTGATRPDGAARGDRTGQGAARGTESASGATSPGATSPNAASGGGPRSAGADLSRMLARLPQETLADVHTGDAVLIVASASSSGNYTAITLLSGVEQILSATPSGARPITLSPWNLSVPEGGGQ